MDQAASNSALVGGQIGNYHVISRLGAGAMGEVFLGEHPKIGRKVAIKVLVAQLSANPDMAQRFISEAKAVNTINHPNIIQIFDFGELPDGRLYFTMEYLEGHDLTHHLRENAPLKVSEVAELLAQLAGALDAAHQAGIIHRDLKPDNIFLVNQGPGKPPLVKVLDFGIAKLAQPDLSEAGLTSSGVIMGTPIYMSPEQAAGRVREISTRSDIYALGVIVYQALSGYLPLEADTTAELLYKHISADPVPLLARVDGLPEGLSTLLDQSLAKDPDQRQQTVTQLYEQFEQACEGLQEAMAATISNPGLVRAASLNPNLETVAGETEGHSTSTLRGSAGELLAVNTMKTDREKKGGSLPLILGLVALGLGGLLVALYWGGVFGAKEKKSGSGSQRSAMGPMDRPVVAGRPMRRGVRVAPRPVMTGVTLHSVSVQSSTPRVTVEVRIGDQKIHADREPPFTLEVKEGERVTLRASRSGYKDQIDSWVATANRKVAIALERSRVGRPHRPRPSGMRRRPMRHEPIVVRVRPRPMVTPMAGMKRLGVGTLRPMFE